VVTDEPKTLPYANPSVCSISADAGHAAIAARAEAETKKSYEENGKINLEYFSQFITHVNKRFFCPTE